MQLNLAGKTAIITGGSAGIGLACAQALYAEGVSVLIAARDEERLAEALTAIEAHGEQSGAQALSVSADVSTAEGVERASDRALSTWGPRGHPDQQRRLGAERRLLQPGRRRLSRGMGPEAAWVYADGAGAGAADEGAAGGTASSTLWARRAHNPTPTFLAGGTANAAIINFTKGISQDLAPYGVRINAISPGPVNTERARQLAAPGGGCAGHIGGGGQIARRIASVPLGRMAEADEIADMALFLASDRAASITGAEILIDGGSTASV